VIRQVAAYAAGIALILVSGWVMLIKAAVSSYDPDAFYE
jgi:hypothetical protein